MLQIWTPVRRPMKADVFSHKTWQAGAEATPDVSGHLQLTLRNSRGRLYGLPAGSHVRLTNGTRTYWLGVPLISSRMTHGRSAVSGITPRHSSLVLRLWSDEAAIGKRLSTPSNGKGRYSFKLKRPLPAGTSVDVVYTSPSGNLVQTTLATRDIVAQEGTDIVTGHAAPGETLIVRVDGSRHHLLGTGVTATSTRSGMFTALLFGSHVHSVRLRAGDYLTLSDGLASSTYRVPALVVRRSISNKTITGWARQSGDVRAVLLRKGRVIRQTTLQVRKAGRFSMKLTGTFAPRTGRTLELVAGSPYSGAGAVELSLAPISRVHGQRTAPWGFIAL